MADSVRELKENCPPAVRQRHRPRHFCGSPKPLRESNTGDMPVVKSAASKCEGGQSYQQAKRMEKEEKENRPRKPSGRKTRQKTKQSNLDFKIFHNYTQMSAPFMQSNNIKKMKVPQRPISKTSDYVPKPANHDFMPASRDHMIKLQGPLPKSLQGSPESQLSNWTERNRGTCTSGYHSDTDTEAIATSSQVDDCNVATEVMVTASNFTVSQSGTDTETVVTNKMDSYHRNTFKRAITTDRKACCQGDATMATKRTNSHCSSGNIHDSSNNIQHLSPLSNISSTMFVCHRSPSGHPVQSNVSEQASVDYRGSTRASGRSTFGCRLSRGQQTAKTSHINSDTHSASGYKASDVGSASDSVTLFCQSDNTLTTKELETPYTAAPYCENEMNEAEKVQHWLNVSSFQTEVMRLASPGWLDHERPQSSQESSFQSAGSSCPLSMSELTTRPPHRRSQDGHQMSHNEQVNQRIFLNQYVNKKLDTLTTMNGNHSWSLFQGSSGRLTNSQDPYSSGFNSSWNYESGSYRQNKNFSPNSYGFTSSGPHLATYGNVNQSGTGNLTGSNGYTQMDSMGYPPLDGSIDQYKPVSTELKEHRERIAQIDQQLLSLDKEIMSCEGQERWKGLPQEQPSVNLYPYNTMSMGNSVRSNTSQIYPHGNLQTDSSFLSKSSLRESSAGDYNSFAHEGMNSTHNYDHSVPRLNTFMSSSQTTDPTLTLSSFEGQGKTRTKMNGSPIECSLNIPKTVQRQTTTALAEKSGNFTSTAIQTSPNKSDLDIAPNDLSLALTPAKGSQGSRVMSSHKLGIGPNVKGRIVQSNLPLDDLSPLFSQATPLKLSTGLPTKSGSHLPQPLSKGVAMLEDKRPARDSGMKLSDDKRVTPYKHSSHHQRSWSSPRLSFDSDESLSSEEDVDSLLNRSVELQSHIRVSCDETDAYQPLSPTGWRGYSPSPTQFARSLRRTHSVESIVGKFDTDSNSFTITSMRTNLRWEDAYVYGSKSPSMVSPTLRDSLKGRCYSPSSSSSTCMPRSTTEESTNGTSSSQWAIRLIEALHNTDPVTRQCLVLKARCFRRWQSLVRETRRQKTDDNHAICYYHRKLLARCFKHWREEVDNGRQLHAAIALYKKHALRKGIQGLRFAVQQSRHLEDVLETKMKQHLLAKYFHEWQEKASDSRKNTIRDAFNRWRQFKLQSERMKLLENMAERRLLSKAYSVWKGHFKDQQQEGVAALHYKVTVLGKGWKAWKQFTTISLVRSRRKEVAKIHYEERLLHRTFHHMKETAQKSQTAEIFYCCRLLARMFRQFHEASQLSKAHRLRVMAETKEYRRLVLLKSFFARWREELREQRANNVARKRLESRAFEIWKLRWRRNLLHRQVKETRANEELKHMVLQGWLEAVRQQRQDREAAMELLEKVVCSHWLRGWHDHTQRMVEMRASYAEFVQKRALQTKRRYMKTWQAQLHTKLTQQKAKELWTLKCVRRAVYKWHSLVYRRRLEIMLQQSQPLRDRALVKAYLKRWIHAKQQLDCEKDRADIAYSAMQKKGLQRMFVRWRILTQQELTIAPLKSKKRRKEIARVFDSWRARVLTKRKGLELKASFHHLQMQKIFTKWRLKTQSLVLQQKVALSSHLHLLRKCFSGWCELVERRKNYENFTKCCSQQHLRRAFQTWRCNLGEVRAEREEEEAEQARVKTLLASCLRTWRAKLSQQRWLEDTLLKRMAEQHCARLVRGCFIQWKLQYQGAAKARYLEEELGQHRLQRIFKVWQDQTSQSFHDSIAQFHANMAAITPRDSMERNDSVLSGLSQTSSVSSSGFQSIPWQQHSGMAYPLNGQLDSSMSTSPTLDGQHFGQLLIQDLIHVGKDEEKDDVFSYHEVLSQSDIGSAVSTPRFKLLDSPRKRELSEEKQKSLDRRISYEKALSIERANYEQEKSSLLRAGSLLEPLNIDIDWSATSDIQELLVWVVKRWQHWPVSAAFEQWKEYVAQRRVIKYLQTEASARCENLKLHWAFDQWKHGVIAMATARKYHESCLLRRCFTALKEYTVSRKMKQEQKRRADDFREAMLLQKVLETWTQKHQDKQQCEVSLTAESPRLSGLGNYVQRKIQTKSLRYCMHVWVMRYTQLQEVKRYHSCSLVKRCFRGWLTWTREKSDMRIKSEEFCQKRLKRAALRGWQRRYRNTYLAEQRYVLVWKEFLADILERWHFWAAERHLQSAVGEQLEARLRLRAVAKTFRIWKAETHKCQQMQKIYHASLLSRSFHAWQKLAQRKKELAERLSDFAVKQQENKLRRVFLAWKSDWLHSKAESELHQLRVHHNVVKMAKKWKQMTQQSRGERRRRKALLAMAFKCWRGRLQYKLSLKGKVYILGRLWHWKAQRNLTQENMALQLQDKFRRRQLSRVFTHWKETYWKLHCAEQHHIDSLVASAFQGWLEFTEKKKDLAYKLQLYLDKRHTDQLIVAMKIWKKEFKGSARRKKLLQHHLEERNHKLVNRMFVKWHDETLRQRAEKRYEGSILLRIVVTWHKWAHDKRARMARCQELQTSFARNNLRSAFLTWHQNTRVQHRAAAHYQQTLTVRMFFSWLHHVRHQKQLKQLSAQFQQRKTAIISQHAFLKWKLRYQVNMQLNVLVKQKQAMHERKLLQDCFALWIEKVCERQAHEHYERVLMRRAMAQWKRFVHKKRMEKQMEGDLMDLAQQHYEASLRKLVLHAWCNEVLVARQLKKRQLHLVARYAKIWKQRVAMVKAAKQMAQKHKVDHCWRKWRKALIQSQVSKNMLIQDNKQVLTQVFVTWRQMALLRSLAKKCSQQQQSHQLRLTFQQWRQKYNSSSSGGSCRSSNASLCTTDRSYISGRSSVDTPLPMVMPFSEQF